MSMPDPEATPGESEAIAMARSLFLRDDSYYGCAETALVTLQSAFGIPNPGDSSSAMALNGGVAYSGGMCGALTGAALALGRLAEKRIGDHGQAKVVARGLTRNLIAAFEDRFSASNCRDLVDYELSIPSQHDALIESGIWRDTCMKQIEFSVERLVSLNDEGVWAEATAGLLGH